jgi:hypothetical protein
VTSYEIFLSSNGAGKRAAILRETIRVKLKELGIDDSAVTFFDDSSISSRDRKAPTVGAFLSMARNPTPRTGIVDLVHDGLMVVPVVDDLVHFNDFVFDELRGINGMDFGVNDPNLECVASVRYI